MEKSKVVAFEKFEPRRAARGSYRVILHLECGHKVRRKGSQVPRIETKGPKWVRCPFCN